MNRRALRTPNLEYSPGLTARKPAPGFNMRRLHPPTEIAPMYCSVVESPIGLLGLAATERGLCEIRTGVANPEEFFRSLEINRATPPRREDAVFQTINRQLSEYFRGRLREFSVALDLREGTAFQQQVWRTLRTIPFGRTRSYSWLAQRVGNPQARRAVGQANGKNPLPIVIPCHRVIRASGDLGGYSGGTDLKRFLLDLEQRNGAI